MASNSIIGLAIAFGSAALACTASAPLADSGLGVGQMTPAFHPYHASGPDANTSTCPV